MHPSTCMRERVSMKCPALHCLAARVYSTRTYFSRFSLVTQTTSWEQKGNEAAVSVVLGYGTSRQQHLQTFTYIYGNGMPQKKTQQLSLCVALGCHLYYLRLRTLTALYWIYATRAPDSSCTSYVRTHHSPPLLSGMNNTL